MFEAVVFLSLVQVLLACTPVPKGQEKYVYLQITNMDKIPVQFAWGKADIGVAETENDAKKNLKQAVKKAILRTIKQEAKASGIRVENLAPLNTQIKPKVYYVPLNCDNKVISANSEIITCAAKTAKTGWCCSVTDKMIEEIQIPGQTNATNPIPVPEPYRQLIVELSVGSLEVAAWNKAEWASRMANVEQNLKNNKEYEKAFRNVNVKVLGVY